MKTIEMFGNEVKQIELEDVLNAKRLPDSVTIEDWPYGRTKRCIMEFSVETHKTGKQRMVRQSTFNGRVNKPKKKTYAMRVFLIEIDDKIGRLELSQYGVASVYMESSGYGSATFYDDDMKKLWKTFVE